MSSEFTAAVRALLLPISPDHEQQYLIFVAAHLEALGVPASDHSTWIGVELRSWRQHGSPSPDLRQLVRTALYSAGRDPVSFMFTDVDGAWDQIALRASGSYFQLHSGLLQTHLLEHDAARQLMSHMAMIARLCVFERMTASEISRLVAARDQRFARNWRVINAILQRLGIAASVDTAAFEGTFKADIDSEAAMFGDLDIQGSIARCAAVAADLGCPGDFNQWLTDLIIVDKHDPYLLILHFQLIVQEHFDHALTYPYEFNPRGQNATWLTAQYAAAGIPVAQSAFLNNAKATLRFDSSWVAGRTDHTRGATALASVLMQMESLGALAKVEMAAHLRSLLARHIRLEFESNGPLPNKIPDLDRNEILRLVRRVGVANTGTTGIIEQRLVDCLGTCRHRSTDGWAPRGVGDSVFAPNLPRRKMGDAEFMSPVAGSAIIRAYEAHGGQLSPAYVADHMSTLGQVLGQRLEELTAIEPLAGWDIRIIFLAHSFAANLNDSLVMGTSLGPVTLHLAYVRFDDLEAELAAIPDLQEIARNYFVARLNSPFVHSLIRQRALELVAP